MTGRIHALRIAPLAATIALSACGELAVGQAGAAPAPCENALVSFVDGGNPRLVATFQITPSDLAAWQENPNGSHAPSGMSPARSLDPSAVIFACYFDGPITLRAHPPPGGANPTVARAVVIVDETGQALEVRGGTEASLPLVAPAGPTATPPGVATATKANWRTTPITSSEIVALLNGAGLTSHVLPPAPARVLLYGSSDLDLLGFDNKAIPGAVIYRYPSVGAAMTAFQSVPVQHPERGTVDFIARPYFIVIGDAIVNIATNDEHVAGEVVTALVRH